MNTDPTLWSATEQATAIRERAISSSELLELCVARIDAVDTGENGVNAVCTLDLERARAAARVADDETVRGHLRGPLHGLPFTVKDAIATEGIRSTGGAEVMLHHVPTADAPAVASLRSAGAIVFGKTNLPEWSGDWQSFNPMFGTTVNPWSRALTPGGSSGGAAAAVSCGMTSFELGTDIGGSVRVPSAFCGVFGHKPSFGIIPTLGYLDEPNGGTTEGDVNTFGPMARSAADLRVLLDVLAGPSAERAAAWRLELPDTSVRTLQGLRVAAWIDEPAAEVDSVMAGVLHAAVDAMESAGAVVDRRLRPDVDVTHAWTNGARLIGAAVSVSDDDDRGLSHRDWLFMHRDRERLRAAWADVFRQVDVVLCPVAIVPAFPHLQDGVWHQRMLKVNGVDRRYVEIEAWPALVGAAYLPATSVPVGATPEGLPVGVQVVAPLYHDRLAIRVGELLAEATADLGGGYRVPPVVRST